MLSPAMGFLDWMQFAGCLEIIFMDDWDILCAVGQATYSDPIHPGVVRCRYARHNAVIVRRNAKLWSQCRPDDADELGDA